MKLASLTPVAAVLAVSLTSVSHAADSSPAATKPMAMMASGKTDKQCPEGKCGEGKCGEGKCGEGKCGAMMDAAADTNNDGNISKEEFTAFHDKKFAAMDANGNGVIEAAERKMMMTHKDLPEGKCGGKMKAHKEGGCGAAK